ncbi:MAG: endonuclease/exonuclease/phosphatase family protein [Xanthomonadales bacterium]|nr:endonuclease/exonuclease/phosphatase family protein [Xanthomonadales bacterium]
MRFPESYLRMYLLGVTLLILSWAGVAKGACAAGKEPLKVVNSSILRVVTLNMAHGRKDGRNQMLLKGETIRNNLVELAGLLDRADAHVIALQEADAESAWSGKFNHVDFLSENTIYSCNFHGIHASNRVYDFGTALLSKYEFQGAFAHSFVPSKPTTTKGFSLAALDWNPAAAPAEPVRVKFASVHLDFSRRSVRRSQIDEMVRVLAGIEGPLVIMGDFNTDWQTEDSSLKYFAEQLDLTVFEPHAEGFATYGDKGVRLDWILISKQLKFSKYAVFPDVVSDHYAVAAEIGLKESDDD